MPIHSSCSPPKPPSISGPAWPSQEWQNQWFHSTQKQWKQGENVWETLSTMALDLYIQYYCHCAPQNLKAQKKVARLRRLLLSWLYAPETQSALPPLPPFKVALGDHEKSLFYLLKTTQVHLTIVSWLAALHSSVPHVKLQRFHDDFLSFVLRKDVAAEGYPLRNVATHLIEVWLNRDPPRVTMLKMLKNTPHPVLVRLLTRAHPDLITTEALTGSGLFMAPRARSWFNLGVACSYQWTEEDKRAYTKTLHLHAFTDPFPTTLSLSHLTLPNHWRPFRFKDVPFYKNTKKDLLHHLSLRAAFLRTPFTSQHTVRALLWCMNVAFKGNEKEGSQERIEEISLALKNAEVLWQNLSSETFSLRVQHYLGERLKGIRAKVEAYSPSTPYQGPALHSLDRLRVQYEALHLERLLIPHVSPQGLRPRL